MGLTKEDFMSNIFNTIKRRPTVTLVINGCIKTIFYRVTENEQKIVPINYFDEL